MTKGIKVPISLLVPCKNEEANLDRCLQSVPWVAEIFVVDSNSNDKTSEIAELHGAKVVQFEYKGGWPKKKNWALENLPFSNEWVLIVDADECLPPEAEEEIRGIVTNANDMHSGYWINRRYFFMGKDFEPLKSRLREINKLLDLDEQAYFEPLIENFSGDTSEFQRIMRDLGKFGPKISTGSKFEVYREVQHLFQNAAPKK